MFPGLGGRPDRNDFAKMTQANIDVEMAAHGVSVVEIGLTDGKWRPRTDSQLNRRITVSTEMSVDGPAAGHDRLKTAADSTGRRVQGTLNNCAGGQTPWGTYLTAEENFHGYFWTDRKAENGRRLTKGLGGAQQKSYDRYGVPSNWYSWGKYYDRFNVDKEANEPNRFGWIVEIDPFDATSTPVKHTALGRFRHEGAEVIVNRNGQVVIYTGDDAQFDYVYRFVSKDRIREGDKAHNMRLLSEGTLSVARYNEDGTATWLPLVFGEGPLTPANGFNSQADVVIDARLAADLLKATPMDRPEDVQPHPSSGKVIVILTNNERRRPEQVDKANPRPENNFGHIIEMTAPDGDHTAEHLPLGHAGAVRRSPHRGGGRALAPRHQRERLVCIAGQRSHRRGRAAVDRHRSGNQLVEDAARRRALCAGDRRRRARPLPPVLQGARWRGAVRAVLHARTAPRRSSRCSIRPPTASRSGRRSAGNPPSRTRQHAGRTSRRTCRRGLPWSPSARRAAARSQAPPSPRSGERGRASRHARLLQSLASRTMLNGVSADRRKRENPPSRST